ncbi:MAG: hypothetical protein ABJG68_04370 [Crocinitomicaceae bacterium]
MALPVIGYLFFDWTIPVIIAFYFFDFLGGEFTRYKRHQKIMLSNAPEQRGKLTLSFALAAVAFIACVLMAYFIFNEIALIASIENSPIVEIVDFMKREGWFLLPVVLLASVMKDKMAFYLPKKYLEFSFPKVIRAFYLEIAVLTVLICLGLYGYLQLLQLQVDGLIMLAIFILVKLIFDYVLVRKLKDSAKL